MPVKHLYLRKYDWSNTANDYISSQKRIETAFPEFVANGIYLPLFLEFFFFENPLNIY